jgi:thioredoxin 1
MVVICLGPICLPLWPVVALTLKPIWDRVIPESIKHQLEQAWISLRRKLCPRRSKEQSKAIRISGGGHIVKVTSIEHYKNLLKESGDVPVFVKFTADFCGPCKIISPHVETLAGTYSERMKFCEVDIEEFDDLALEAGVTSIPAFHIMIRGSKKESFVGANVAALEKICEKFATLRKDIKKV